MSLIKISTLKTWSSIPNHESLLAQIRKTRKLIGPGKQNRIIFQATSFSNSLISLTAKELERDVYKMDLSALVSGFAGETDRNLAAAFAEAESKDWILYFDEADALFGKRTEIRSAHDKYSNLYVPYLLQCIEQYKGIVIFSCIRCSSVSSKSSGAMLLTYLPG